jgi:hypothetical protein
MKKESMVLWNFEIPQKDLTDLKKLAGISGDSASYHTRKALKIYIRKEFKKYKGG